jgi:SAM-dependent methyltransferase
VETCEPAARYGRERFGLDIRATILEKAGLESGSFDLIHASHLIEHLNDPRAFVDELLRLCSPGGAIILTTPNIAGLQARILGSEWRSAIYDHLYLFSTRTLDALLAGRGLRVVRTATWGGWAAGLEPSFIKRPLDFLAKRLGFGDVMAFLCRRETLRSGGGNRV